MFSPFVIFNLLVIAFITALAIPLAAVEFVVVRHGETDWNKERILQGQTDIPMNAEGERQVVALAERFSGKKFDAVYTSDLCRCTATTEILIAGRDLNPVEDPLLREINFGELEGRTLSEIESEMGSYFAGAYTPSGAESFAEFVARVEKVFTDYAYKHIFEERILIVTHGGIHRLLLRMLPTTLNGELPSRSGNACYLVVNISIDGTVVISELGGWDSGVERGSGSKQPCR